MYSRMCLLPAKPVIDYKILSHPGSRSFKQAIVLGVINVSIVHSSQALQLQFLLLCVPTLLVLLFLVTYIVRDTHLPRLCKALPKHICFLHQGQCMHKCLIGVDFVYM